MDRAEFLPAPRYDTRLSWKIFISNLIWWKYLKNMFSRRKSRHSSHPDCHRACPGPIEHYSPRGKPSLRVTFGSPGSVNFASAKRFWIFGHRFDLGDVSFQQILSLSNFKPPWSNTVDGFNIFTQPMDRAELLHGPRYDTRLSRKNILVKFNVVKLMEQLIFPWEKYT